TTSLPLLTFSLPTERSGGADWLDVVADALFSDVLPKLEKFQVPLAPFSSVIWGSSRVISVTFNCFEKMSGISSTPTLRDFAVMNHDLLKVGSSAIAMFSPPTLPDRIDRLRLPTVTWRPNALLASDWILGRKLFTLIRNGSAISVTRKTATAIPTMRNQRFFMIVFRCLRRAGPLATVRIVSRNGCLVAAAPVSDSPTFLLVWPGSGG